MAEEEEGVLEGEPPGLLEGLLGEAGLFRLPSLVPLVEVLGEPGEAGQVPEALRDEEKAPEAPDRLEPSETGSIWLPGRPSTPTSRPSRSAIEGSVGSTRAGSRSATTRLTACSSSWRTVLARRSPDTRCRAHPHTRAGREPRRPTVIAWSTGHGRSTRR